MTWGDWIESEYCTTDLYIWPDNSIHIAAYDSSAASIIPSIHSSENILIYAIDPIINNHNYIWQIPTSTPLSI